MMGMGDRRRVLPGRITIGYSLGLFAAGAYVSTQLPFTIGIIEPLIAGASLAIGLTAYRLARLRRGLQPPYGGGKVSTVTAKGLARSGQFMFLGTLGLFVGILGTVFILPPEVFFLMIFALVVGLPLANLGYYLGVRYFEQKKGGRIYAVLEDDENDEGPVLKKSFELSPVKPE